MNRIPVVALSALLALLPLTASAESLAASESAKATPLPPTVQPLIVATPTPTAVVTPAFLPADPATASPSPTPTPSPTPSPTPAPSPSPTPAPSPTPYDAANALPTQAEMDAAALGSRIVMRGSEGADVLLIQQRLNALGYDAGEADGVFGRQTHRALMAFQRAHGLAKVDGKAGEETLGRLFSADVIVRPTPIPTSSPKPTPTAEPTPTPLSTPEPTPTPNAQAAPFALAEIELTIDGHRATLMLGKTTDGQTLYPLCGVMAYMGYEATYAAGSWSLTRAQDGADIALITGGVDGLCAEAMASYNGVVILPDGDSLVYVYGAEAYLTAPMLSQLGVSLVTAGGRTMIL